MTPAGNLTLREQYEAKKAASKPETTNPDNEVKALLDAFVMQQQNRTTTTAQPTENDRVTLYQRSCAFDLNQLNEEYWDRYRTAHEYLVQDLKHKQALQSATAFRLLTIQPQAINRAQPATCKQAGAGTYFPNFVNFIAFATNPRS